MNLIAPELLAPADTLKNMRYAFAYGADAVYAGQPRYSLRVRNNEFDHGARRADHVRPRPDHAGAPALPADADSPFSADQYREWGQRRVLAATGLEGISTVPDAVDLSFGLLMRDIKAT
jgi:hypothetical protein